MVQFFVVQFDSVYGYNPVNHIFCTLLVCSSYGGRVLVHSPPKVKLVKT